MTFNFSLPLISTGFLFLIKGIGILLQYPPLFKKKHWSHSLYVY